MSEVPEALIRWWKETPKPTAEEKAAFNENSEGEWEPFVDPLTDEELDQLGEELENKAQAYREYEHLCGGN